MRNMKIAVSILSLLFACSDAFVAPSLQQKSSSLFASDDAILDKVKDIFKSAPELTEYDGTVTAIFPGALSNQQLETRVVSILSDRGFTTENTLLCTSLCCDE